MEQVLKVWVVVSGTYYESSEVIDGVYSTEEKAKGKLSTIEKSTRTYSYIEEREVE